MAGKLAPGHQHLLVLGVKGDILIMNNIIAFLLIFLILILHYFNNLWYCIEAVCLKYSVIYFNAYLSCLISWVESFIVLTLLGHSVLSFSILSTCLSVHPSSCQFDHLSTPGYQCHHSTTHNISYTHFIFFLSFKFKNQWIFCKISVDKFDSFLVEITYNLQLWIIDYYFPVTHNMRYSRNWN